MHGQQNIKQKHLEVITISYSLCCNYVTQNCIRLTTVCFKILMSKPKEMYLSIPLSEKEDTLTRVR